MKKFIILVMIAVLVISLCFGLVGCSLFANDDDNQNTTTVTEVALDVNKADALSSQDMFEVHEKYEPELVYSFRDDDNAYYLFDLGKINNVPLEGFSKVIHFVNHGQKVSHTIETTSITATTVSNSVSTTTEESVSVSTSQSVKLALEVGKKDICKFSAEYANSRTKGESVTNAFSESYSKAEEYTNSNKTIVTMSFDENSKDGYYAYVWTGVIEVYAIVMKPLNKDEYIVDYYSEVLTQWPDFYYFQNSSEFVNYEYGTIEFEVPNNLALPNNHHPLWSTERRTVYLGTKPLSCDLDGPGDQFNPNKPDENGNNIHYSHQFEFGKFAIQNVVSTNSNEYSLSGDSVNISFRMTYDSSSLPLQDNMTSRAVEDDSNTGPFYDLPYDIGNRKVGYGLIVVLVTYEDGSPSERICIENAFKDKKAGELIDIVTISKPCTIDIAILYELVMWAPGFLGIHDDYWMNWRINQKINIVD